MEDTKSDKGGNEMIYSQQRFYACCDECGKTIETNAATEEIAKETIEREGWKVFVRRRTLLLFEYICYCPKCKEETK